jgi:preprotein translocase subunit SecA
LAEILPEAFAVVKETARRLAQNGGLTVKATSLDMALAATKDFVEIKGENAFGKTNGMLQVKKLFGIWFTTTLSLLVV